MALDYRLRNTTLLAALVCASALALSSCASATVIPLEGSTTALSALVGEWSGTYTSPDAGRSGTLWFRLIEGEDHAHGDVRMIPRGKSMPLMSEVRTSQPPDHEQFLGIRFVRVSELDLAGALDQYWDPDAGCFANTSFRGRNYGDRLVGTFETRLSTGVIASGIWQAARQPGK